MGAPMRGCGGPQEAALRRRMLAAMLWLGSSQLGALKKPRREGTVAESQDASADAGQDASGLFQG